MAVEDEEDMDAYFDPDEFGVAATWSFNSATINGIFDAEYADPLGLFESVGPVFMCRSASFSDDAAQGQTLTINSTVYTMVEVRPDGTGMTLVRLRG